MLIGIMSDAHDSIQGVKDALSIFSKKGVSMVLFAGDMIGSGNCYAFENLGIPLKLVYGNNDGDRVGLKPRLCPCRRRVPGRLWGDRIGWLEDSTHARNRRATGKGRCSLRAL